MNPTNICLLFLALFPSQQLHTMERRRAAGRRLQTPFERLTVAISQQKFAQAAQLINTKFSPTAAPTVLREHAPANIARILIHMDAARQASILMNLENSAIVRRAMEMVKQEPSRRRSAAARARAYRAESETDKLARAMCESVLEEKTGAFT